MDDHDNVSHEVRLEEDQFWESFRNILRRTCETESSIKRALRDYVLLASKSRDKYLVSENALEYCCYLLLSSKFFTSDQNQTLLLLQVLINKFLAVSAISGVLLHIITAVLLHAGRANEETFVLMMKQGAFPRLTNLLSQTDAGSDPRLHKALHQILYEMALVQRLDVEDLVQIDDGFIAYFLGILEQESQDVNDPFRSSVMQVLLVLNEQYMVAEHDRDSTESHRVSNILLKFLSLHGPDYKKFGENMMILLYTEVEWTIQLLILKLLYLIFTTPSTSDYFSITDARVLVDIIIHHLKDLPPEATALRHTYLRVLYPLSGHQAFQRPPYYKREEMVDVLAATESNAPDETTQRLLRRFETLDWLEWYSGDINVFALPGERVERSISDHH